MRVPVNADFEADLEAMRAQINPNTVALAGSAGTYPHGVVDPIEKLSDLALEHKLGLHVDGCLGGFILPWIEKLGYDVPVFDFRLPGVTSITCDTHKYGYTLKGTSTVTFRTKQLRRTIYFAQEDWPGGAYFSPTSAGSRSGGLSAAMWAAMVSTGEEGLPEGRPGDHGCGRQDPHRHRRHPRDPHHGPQLDLSDRHYLRRGQPLLHPGLSGGQGLAHERLPEIRPASTSASRCRKRGSPISPNGSSRIWRTG